MSRLRICIPMIVAMLVLVASPALASDSESGYQGCFSPKTVTTYISGYDDHYHSHESSSDYINFDISLHVSQRNFGWLQADWYVWTKGQMNHPNTYPTCQT
jgi:hypothetical protein